ncbi:hypothetical protein D3C81_1980270 [compost metagenome]
MEKTRNELRFSRTTVEDLKWQLRHIDPRANKLPSHEQEYFLKRWLAADSVEELLEKDKGPVHSHNVTKVERETPVESTSYYSNAVPRIID